MQTENYFDTRHSLYVDHFKQGLAYEEYLQTATDQERERWEASAKRIVLTPDQKALLGSFIREINVIVLSGTWCGDCVRQGPMFRAIEKACPVMKVKYFDNKKYPELANELRICGGSRVPVVLALSEDFNEVARLGDRPLSVYRLKAETQLGPACDAGVVPPSEQELAVELSEWVQFFERVHLLLRLSGTLRSKHGD